MVDKGDVEMWLEEWIPHLTIEQEGQFIVVRAREFPGKETFSKVLATVRQHGGEYISAGKESHFRVSTGGQVDAPKGSVCPWCGKPLATKIEKV